MNFYLTHNKKAMHGHTRAKFYIAVENPFYIYVFQKII